MTSFHHPYSARDIAAGAFYLVVWIGLDWIGFLFEIAPGVSPWYPPHGFSLAFLLIFGLRFWPLLALGPAINGSIFWLPGEPLALAGLVIAITAAYGGAAWAIRSVAVSPSLETVRDAGWFLGIGLIASLALAPIATLVLAVSGLVPFDEFWSTAAVFWIGDALGIFGLAPLLMTVVFPALHRLAGGGGRTWRPALHGIVGDARHPGPALAIAVAAGVLLALANRHDLVVSTIPVFLLLAPAIGAALVYGIVGAAAMVAAINIGLAASMQAAAIAMPLLDLQVLVTMISGGALVLGAYVTERKQRLLAAEAGRAESERAARAESKLAERTEELTERVKEVRCLYQVTRLTSDSTRTIEDICDRVAQVLPAGWRHPEAACARITLHGLEFTTPGWNADCVRQVAPIRAAEEEIGAVEVGYATAAMPGDRPFQPEERELLDSVALLLGRTVERHEAYLRLQRAQRVELLGQLTGGVAHDFNNLLSVIQGNLEMLREDADDPAVHGYVEPCLRAAQRGAELTHRMLAFARRQSLSPERADVNGLVEGTISLLRRTLGEGVEIKMALEPEAPNVMVDQGQLETALMNLAVNARDAMPSGGEITIETGAVDLDEDYAARHDEVLPGGYVRVAVTDTGIGMDQKTLSRAFEPFFTTKDVGGGTGLGLSMVYGFARQSGGHARIDSRLGIGTTVSIYLPVATGDGQWERVEETVEDTPEAHGEHVLVVEDEPDVQSYIAHALEKAGYRPSTAESADAALYMLTRGPLPDAILTDIGLPGTMNGIDLGKAVNDQWPDLPVVLMSGHITGFRSRLHGRGPKTLVLQKPFTRVELLKRLAQAMNESGTAEPEGTPR